MQYDMRDVDRRFPFALIFELLSQLKEPIFNLLFNSRVELLLSTNQLRLDLSSLRFVLTTHVYTHRIRIVQTLIAGQNYSMMRGRHNLFGLSVHIACLTVP